MEKRTFLKSTGLLGLVAALAPARLLSGDTPPKVAATCVLIPSETVGPFPLDLTDNAFFFRRDVREDRVGVPHRVRIRVIGEANCEPMPNVRVHIWHCDRDGAYSGYDVSTNPGQAGKTYLRGYQLTDANGEAEFLTIFPGWYPGRVCHIHFQVRVSSSYAATSQLTYPQSEKQALYTEHSALYPKGIDPLTPSQDGIFADGYEYQLATLTTTDEGSSYDSFLEVTVRGTGATSVGHTERQNARHFTLGQNYPNPVADRTTIPFTLQAPSDISLKVFDLQGKLVLELVDRGLSAGAHHKELHLPSLGLQCASYAYQLSVTNVHGTWTDVKLMTHGS